eukprot:TRINITY_DN607_c2_g1_i1.p1 TRINITY_DN607_c2_g1~~TRINITY_DN607_c2_g1_i1.p1  ORF type:complete len:373 (-),score=84.08 TRINITY_DN607_c2_g1_i1:147-1265(-)
MAAPQYIGTVRSFNPHKGWGFIECEETKKIYGSDVFLLKNDTGGFGVSKGDQVSFNVTQIDKGARAMNAKVLTVGPDGLQSFFGELKSFHPQKGYGFISSPGSESVFGKDCFVIRSEFGDAWPEEGMHVQFKAKMGERGPVATDVRVLDPPGGKGMAPPMGMGMGMGFGGKGLMGGFGGYGGKGFMPPAFGGYGKGMFGGFDGSFGGKGFMPFSASSAFASQDPKETDVFFGTVKAINERGFGHIASDAMQKIYSKDIFAHKTSIDAANVQPGQKVSFNVSPGPKGAHATNIKPFDETSSGMVFVGTVKAFNDSKGWGFIESPAAMPIFLSEIFLHRNELGGKSVAIGDQVQFTVDISSGRASAKTVSTIGR